MTEFEEDKWRLSKELEEVLKYLITIKDKINSAQTEYDFLEVLLYYEHTFFMVNSIILNGDGFNE